MADLQTIIARMMGQEEEQGQQRRPPQQGRGIFGGGLGRASRDFQSAFDGAANSVMQRAPLPFINALSDSGIPGWGGLRRARNTADASALGLEAPSMNPVPTGIPLSNALAPPMPQASTAPQVAAPPPVIRAVAPPSARRPNMAEMEDQAWRDAVARARQNIQTEGVPMFTDPATQRAGQAYAQALDQNRAALAEVERRQGVSFDDWWRHRGRQDQNAPPTPEDMDPFRRYRRPLERRR